MRAASVTSVVDDLKDYLSDSEDRIRGFSLEYRIARRANSLKEKKRKNLRGDQRENSRNFVEEAEKHHRGNEVRQKEANYPEQPVREDSVVRVSETTTGCFSECQR